MLGLFIKDLKLLKAQKKMFMLVGIVTAVVLFNIQDGTEMIGFMAGYMEKQDYEYAFHMGIAAGSASTFSENLATREEIEAVYQQITGKDQEERKK
mgnify:FL=1